MKTTIDIADGLLAEAQKVAREEDSTLKAFVNEALRKLLAERQKPKKPFKLKDCSFGGEGLHPDLKDASWEEIRALIYEGRGG